MSFFLKTEENSEEGEILLLVNFYALLWSQLARYFHFHALEQTSVSNILQIFHAISGLTTVTVISDEDTVI